MKYLSKLTSEKWFIEQEDTLFKVRLGYFDSKEAANALKESLNTPDISYYISEIPLAAITEQNQNASEDVQQKPEVTKEAKQAETVKTETVITPSMDCEDSLHPQNGYFVQAGAFKVKSNAEKLIVKLTATTGKNWFIACGKGLFKVRLGYFSTKQEATNLEKSLKGTGIKYYVNKPKGAVIKDQPKKTTVIPEPKQTAPEQVIKPEKEPKTQVVPVQTPEPEKPKTIVPKQEEPKVVKPAEVKPPVENVVPETKKVTEKTKKLSKDGYVVVPPIDDLNNAPVPLKYYIQAGAFDSKAHAERLSQDLLGLTLKRWFIVFEDGLYKVRLGYFTTKEAAKFIEGTLNTTEVPYYVDGTPVNPLPDQNTIGLDEKNQKQKSGRKSNTEDKKQEVKPVITPRQDKSKTTKEQEPKEKPAVKEPEKTKQNKRNPIVATPPNDNMSTHKFFIQADAFTIKASAELLAADLSARTRQEWFIVYEDDMYKVRLGYFESKDEAKYMEGSLNMPGTYFYIDELLSGKTE
jgi:cell division protein FtsN